MKGAEAEELKRACFVTLVSYLASQPEVLRVAPLHKAKILNAVARAIIQSATVTETPLTDAGLDGSGEVIQVIPPVLAVMVSNRLFCSRLFALAAMFW